MYRQPDRQDPHNTGFWLHFLSSSISNFFVIGKNITKTNSVRCLWLGLLGNKVLLHFRMLPIHKILPGQPTTKNTKLSSEERREEHGAHSTLSAHSCLKVTSRNLEAFHNRSINKCLKNIASLRIPMTLIQTPWILRHHNINMGQYLAVWIKNWEYIKDSNPNTLENTAVWC